MAEGRNFPQGSSELSESHILATAGSTPAPAPTSKRPRAVRRYDLGPAKIPLESTYSIAEVAEHLGCSAALVAKLIRTGRRYKGRGPGLWPTFKVSHKVRRIPLSAIESHKRAMERSIAA